MNQISKVKKRSKKSVFVLMLVVLLASNMSVYAASVAGVDAYLDWYEKTDEIIWDTVQKQPQYEEVISYGDTPGVVTVVADTEQLTRSTIGIDWTVNNNVKMCTSYFSCTQGATVDVMVRIAPSDANVMVGIEREDGMKISIYGNNSIMHTFTVPYAGNWRVFVQNQSGQTITAEGCYIK